jgi:predicted lipase
VKFKQLLESEYLSEKRGQKKPPPTTKFEISFVELKKELKNEKKIRSQAVMDEQVQILLDELKASGYNILSHDAKLGKFRGSYFITSTPITVAYEDESTMQELEQYLKTVYSPKFRIKNMQDGVAKFNIR